ncbi:hypothetical protein CVT24_008121 [Panaeolus cyanescens]|uniref:amidase n=1 Tax=Panaeolus cyanescens TaxID=181874 RepID=A0A409YLH8_9AGAR|nr:hypothetical protein CVT24_008121 [Panaeolus cyanescens]
MLFAWISHRRACYAKQEERRHNLTPLPPLTDEERTTLNLPIAKLVQQIKDGESHPTDTLNAYFKQAFKAHEKTNCLTEILTKQAYEWAQSVNTEGPLAGVPISLKDTIAIAGVDACLGYSSWVGHPVESDSPLVRLLHDAGAIPFVKTNVPITLFSFESYNDVFGRTTNPHSAAHSAGGSTGGEAALLALGGSRVGIGTDVAGSVRVPAHYSGVYTVKSSMGRFPISGNRTSIRGQEAVPAVCSPMARTLEDLEYFWKAVMGMRPWVYDHSVHNMPWRTVELSERPIRWGVMWEDGIVKPSPACERALRMVVDVLKTNGHEVVDVSPPSPYEGFKIGSALILADGGVGATAPMRGSLIETNDAGVRQALGMIRLPSFLRYIYTLWVRYIKREETYAGLLDVWHPKSVAEYWPWVGRRDTYRARWFEWWNKEAKLDFLLTVPNALPAVPHNGMKNGFTSCNYTFLFSILDYSAGVLPITKVDKSLDNVPLGGRPTYRNIIECAPYKDYDPVAMHGLPVGVQVVGQRLEEEKVLEGMKIIEGLLAQSGRKYDAIPAASWAYNKLTVGHGTQHEMLFAWFSHHRACNAKQEERKRHLTPLPPLTQEERVILNLPVSTLVQRIRNGDNQATDVLKTYYKQAYKAHEKTNCLTEILIAKAIPWAENVNKKGPLAGVPVSLKDTVGIEGVDSCIGYSSWVGKPMEADSAIVRLLRDAGAVPFVKTNIPVTLLSFESYNDVFGRTTNPHSSKHSAGGSTGGEAALLAMGGSRIGIGTDVAGSVRVPAHYSGIYTVKASTGRFPRMGNNTSMPGQEGVAAVYSPMARTLEDLDYFWKAIMNMGPWLYDHSVHNIPWRIVDLSQRPIRWGVMWDDGMVKPSPACERALRTVVEILKANGHEVIDVSPPSPYEGFKIGSALILADGGVTATAPMRSTLIETNDSGMIQALNMMRLPSILRYIYTLWVRYIKRDEVYAGLLDVWHSKNVAEYWSWVARREAYRARWFEWWNKEAKVDFVLTVPNALPAVPHDGMRNGFTSCGYTFLFNILDYSAGVLPITKVDQSLDKIPLDARQMYRNTIEKGAYKDYNASAMHGLPVGVQVVGQRLEEEKVLEGMKIIEGLLEKAGMKYEGIAV